MPSTQKSFLPRIVKLIVICGLVALIYHFGFSGSVSHVAKKSDTNTSVAGDTAQSAPPETTLDLTESQLSALKITSAETYNFRVEIEAVGSIAYHEKDEPHDARISSAAKFLVANVRESDSTLIHVGEPVEVKVAVYPNHVFSGRVSTVGVTVYDSGGNPAVDPNTHRIAARCEIADPKNELYPGMLATVVIQVHKPVESVAIPQAGVVREGDGTMTAWVTADRKRFTKRTIKVGLQQNGYDQVLEGIKQGEQVVSDGALLLDNALTGSPSD